MLLYSGCYHIVMSNKLQQLHNFEAFVDASRYALIMLYLCYREDMPRYPIRPHSTAQQLLVRHGLTCLKFSHAYNLFLAHSFLAIKQTKIVLHTPNFAQVNFSICPNIC